MQGRPFHTVLLLPYRAVADELIPFLFLNGTSQRDRPGVGAFLLFGAITLLNKNAQLGIYTTAIAACALLSGLTLAVAAPGTKRGYPTGLKLFTIGYIINLGFLVIFGHGQSNMVNS